MFTVFGCRDCCHAKISLAGNVVKQFSSCKYLGVYIDQDMKWTEHIDYVYKKLTKYIGIFYKLRCKLPSACLRNIYFAYGYPILLCGIELYANSYSTHLDKRCKLNNTLSRLLHLNSYSCLY